MTLFFVNFISFDIVHCSNLFVCYVRLLKFTLRKNRLNAVYAGDIQQKRLPVSLGVVRIYF